MKNLSSFLMTAVATVCLALPLVSHAEMPAKAAACVGCGIGLLPNSWSTIREFELPTHHLPTPTPSPPTGTFVDGGVPIPSQRDLTTVRSLSHAATYRGNGNAPLSSPDSGAPGYADASAPGN